MMLLYEQAVLAAGIILAVAFALAVSIRTWIRLKPANLVGDEKEYARPVGAPNSHQLWLRTPGVWYTNALASRLANCGVQQAGRGLNLIATAYAVGVVIMVANAVGGLIAVPATVIPLLALRERAILSIHLWPDPLLALLFAGFVGALIGGWYGLAGLCLAYAVWIRIDAVGWSAIAIGALVLDGYPQTWLLDVVVLLGPMSLVLVALTVFNGLRHDVWLPDTTVEFNLRVLTRDRARTGETITDLMAETSRGSADEASGGFRERMTALLIRFRTIFGPETFILDKLIIADQARYAEKLGKLERIQVRWGFFVLALLAVSVLPLAHPLLVMAFVVASGLITFVNARSRYRLVLMPILAVILGQGSGRLVAGDAQYGLIGLGAALAGVFVVAVLMIPERREVVR